MRSPDMFLAPGEVCRTLSYFISTHSQDRLSDSWWGGSRGRQAWEVSGGKRRPRPSAVGLSSALDMVTQPGCSWLTTFLSSLEKQGLVFWNPPESRSRMLEPVCLGAAGLFVWVWELTGVDRWFRFWSGGPLRGDTDLTPPASSRVNLPGSL